METTGNESQINHFAREPESMIPAVVCCATGVLGLLWLVAVAACPWLLLV